MKHFTSYYANFLNIPKDYLCIGITRSCPDYFNDTIPNFLFVKDNVLSPSEDLTYRLAKGNISEDDYKKQYISDVLLNVQNTLHQKDIPAWIKYMDNFFGNEHSAEYKGLVFMSYEKPIEFSHRHLFRRLLNNVYHIQCEEFGCKPYQVWGYNAENNQSKELF